MKIQSTPIIGVKSTFLSADGEWGGVIFNDLRGPEVVLSFRYDAIDTVGRNILSLKDRLESIRREQVSSSPPQERILAETVVGLETQVEPLGPHVLLTLRMSDGYGSTMAFDLSTLDDVIEALKTARDDASEISPTNPS